MKIGIDISTVLNHGKDIGAGRYIMNLIEHLFLIDRQDTFILTARYTTDENLGALEELKKSFLSSVKNGEKRLKLKLYKTSPGVLKIWDRFRFPPIEMLGFNADVLHCPDFMIPPTINKNIILTINDLAFIRFPHFNFDWFVKKYTKLVSKNAGRAKKIIAISKSTKNDIIKYFCTAETKIDVTHLAAEEFFKKLDDSGIDPDLLKKFNIRKNFILSVGTIEPRKNYVTLIRAFNKLKDSYTDFDHNLVIVGRTGWKSEAAYQEYETSAYKKDIIFLGRISDEDLLQLYNAADLFVYPSIFEGFGLPVVEAMQCGLAVVASDTSSIPEIVSDKRSLFNPADEMDMADKIIAVLKDKNLKDELSEKSLKEVKAFNWKKTAEKTLEIYRKAIKKAN